MESRYTRDQLLKQGAAGAAVLSGAGALLRAPAADAGSVVSSPSRGGTLSVGVGQIIENINILTAPFYRWGQLIAWTMYEPVVKYDSNGNLVPVLATKVETPDATTTILTIRQGVKFHNGRDMTVDDVVFSLNRIHDPEKPVTQALPLPKDVWGGADKLDNQRVRIRTKKPYRTTELMRFWWVFPQNADSLNLGQQPIGTGPFKFKDFVAGDHITVVRNESYWNGDRPFLDQVAFRFLPDSSVAIANFLSGTINYLHDIPVSLLAQVRGKQNSRLIQGGLFFHWWHAQLYKGPMADVRFRRALRYAFDRKKLNEVAWAGRGINLWNPFDVTPYGIHQKLEKKIKYDPDKARKLIKDAGYAGASVDLDVLKGGVQGELEAPVLQQGFKAAGLKSKIRIEDSSTWVDKLLKTRDYGGILNDYGTLPFPWLNILRYQFFHVDPSPPKFPTVPRSVRPLRAAFDKTAASVQDSEYIAGLKLCQRLQMSSIPDFHSFLAYNYQIAPNNLKGVEATKLGDVRFDEAYYA